MQWYLLLWTMENRFLFSSLSSSAQSCPVRFETIPLSVTDSACYHVSTQDFCYWNSEKCLYLEDIYIVAIDGNNPFSCCRSVSVILTYTKTSLSLVKMRTGIFPLTFLKKMFLVKLNLIQKFIQQGLTEVSLKGWGRT